MLRLLSKVRIKLCFNSRRRYKSLQLLSQNYRYISTRMELKEVCAALNQIAPEKLAEKWDNVGLLVEPTPPHTISTILLTNDLTEDVLEEAVAMAANLIISYHPPIFRSLKRLTSKSWKERIVIRAIENKIAIYSNHTASDAVVNGATDWLSKSLGELTSSHPIIQSLETQNNAKHVSFCVEDSLEFATKDVLENLQSHFSEIQFNIQTSEDTVFISCACNTKKLSDIMEFCESMFPNNCSDIRIYNLENKPVLRSGSGRICTLKFPCSLLSLVERVKQFIDIKHIRVAVGKNSDINTQCSTVALVPGAGASVLNHAKADVYLTGEMSHHEILDVTSNGQSVILCEHSNSERGYLVIYKTILDDLLNNKVNIFISNLDRDPIEIM